MQPFADVFAEVLASEKSASPEALEDARDASFWDGVTYCLYAHITDAASRLRPQLRWRFAIVEDRWALAREASAYYQSGDDVWETCARWAGQTTRSSTLPDREAVRADLKKSQAGAVTTTPLNAYMILRSDPEISGTIRWNDYRKEIVIQGGPLSGRKNLNSTISIAQNWIESAYGVTFNRDDLGHMLALVAEENSFDPLHDYLLGGNWDGQPRIDRLFVNYFGADDTEHNRRIGRRFMLGAVGRALPPETWASVDGKEMGSKFDNVPILEALQGDRKDSAWEVLGGVFYCASSINVQDRDSKMLAASNWFVHLPELAAFKTAEKTSIKSFVTTRSDTFRAPYGRGIIHTPRRCCFAASTNDNHYLDDDTGNRRYWCVRCGTIDLPALMRDRDQLWAEAVSIFLAEMDCPACKKSEDTVAGQRPRCADHRWWLSRDEEKVAAKVAEDRQKECVLTGPIRAWWFGLAPAHRPKSMTTAEVAKDALEMAIDRLAGLPGRAIQTEIGIAMKEIGFKKARASNPGPDGKRHYAYVPTDELLNAPKSASRGLFVVVDGGKSPSAAPPPASAPSASPSSPESASPPSPSKSPTAAPKSPPAGSPPAMAIVRSTPAPSGLPPPLPALPDRSG